jgi:ABC-type branched-subunit amino acid transport system ATPase component
MRKLEAGQVSPADGYAVETAGLTKRFGDRTAVDRVDLRVRPGRRSAIWGPTARGRPR